MLTQKQIDELDADALFEIERQSVGPGWQEIIEKCHKALLKLAPNYKPIQIKEKFGGLRYYVQGVEYGTQAYEVISEAEQASETTCEECGKDGEVKSVVGWFRCLCPDDFDKALERRKDWFKKEE